MFARARYRTHQVLRQLNARLDDEDRALIAQVLPPQLVALFERQREGDRAHAVRVCKALLAQGFREPALLQAALLHDVGKSLGLPVPYRIVVVVAQWLAPGLPTRLAGWSRQIRWLRPFAVSLQHPQFGARLAHEAGASRQVVALIAHHQDETIADEALAPLLAALRRVDDRQ